MKINNFTKNKKEVLREFNKEKYLSAYNYFKNKKFHLKNIDNFFYKKSKEYKDLLKEKKIMEKYIKKYSTQQKNIIDLGSGYGSRSLPLIKKKFFKGKNFFLLDIAPNALKLAKLIYNQINLKTYSIKCGIWDFYNKKNTNIKLPKNSLIFTSYSLVYKKKLNNNFLKFILNLKPKFVIHFEPVFEYSLKKTPLNNKIKEYFLKNNYSLNLLTILKKFEKKKRLKILIEKENFFGTNKYLPFSIIVWKRIN